MMSLIKKGLNKFLQILTFPTARAENQGSPGTVDASRAGTPELNAKSGILRH
jgi:hypothetical protein